MSASKVRRPLTSVCLPHLPRIMLMPKTKKISPSLPSPSYYPIFAPPSCPSSLFIGIGAQPLPRAGGLAHCHTLRDVCLGVRQSSAQHHVLVWCHNRYRGARLRDLQAEECSMAPACMHRSRVHQLLLVGGAISGAIRGQCKEGGLQHLLSSGGADGTSNGMRNLTCRRW